MNKVYLINIKTGTVDTYENWLLDYEYDKARDPDLGDYEDWCAGDMQEVVKGADGRWILASEAKEAELKQQRIKFDLISMNYDFSDNYSEVKYRIGSGSVRVESIQIGIEIVDKIKIHILDQIIKIMGEK